ncbi:MAG: fimbrillin family protein [Tannerellaceae bacterium]|jgi:hypothetical protein|nr:fimbrillin family protein [Tannerellaceae bacterium]
MNRTKTISFISAFACAGLLLSCDKGSEEEVRLAEATFSFSVTAPETKAGLLDNIPDGEVIRLYYGSDPAQPGFQEGRVHDNSIVFDYPVMLQVGNPGRLIAKYVDPQAITQPDMGMSILADTLYADSDDPQTVQTSYAADRYAIELHFKHSNALADFTVLENGEPYTADIWKITATVQTADGNEKTYTREYAWQRQIIIPAGSVLKEVGVIFGEGSEYSIKNETPFTFERNKRYPIEVDIKTGQLIIKATNGIENWGPSSNGTTGNITPPIAKDTIYVGTAEQLAGLSTLVNNTRPYGDRGETLIYTYYVVQTADIDLGGYDNWLPVGDQEHPFTGLYDGRGFTIKGMKISAESVPAGLFGMVANGVIIRNVHIRDCDVSAKNDAGALIGHLSYIVSYGYRSPQSLIEDCTATGKVKGVADIAGVATGGFIGHVSGLPAVIVRCVADVEVEGVNNVGGFVGSFSGSQAVIAGCSAKGDVRASGSYVGGFAGGNGALIRYCTATGAVSPGTDEATRGGFVGKNWKTTYVFDEGIYDQTICFCYTTQDTFAGKDSEGIDRVFPDDVHRSTTPAIVRGDDLPVFTLWGRRYFGSASARHGSFWKEDDAAGYPQLDFNYKGE